MLKKFSSSIYENVVEDGNKAYREMYNKVSTSKTFTYWKEARDLYNSLNSKHKEVFFDILEQTMIDTIARTFYLLDSGMKFDGEDFECDVIINGKSADHDLKDYFLERADELQDSK